MEFEKIEYVLDYDIKRVFNVILKTRRNIVFKNEKLIEVWLKKMEYEFISYFMEDKAKK